MILINNVTMYINSAKLSKSSIWLVSVHLPGLLRPLWRSLSAHQLLGRQDEIMMRSWNPREMTWNQKTSHLTSAPEVLLPGVCRVSCIKHQKHVKHSNFLNSQLHGFIPMKELSKHTSKAQIAGESQTLFCEDLTIASLQPIAMIVIDIFSSWYVCHHLSTKLDISMAAYIDLTEEIIADLHPEAVYIFDAVSEGFHLQVDETKTTKTTKTTNIVSDIWFHMINDQLSNDTADVPGAWCHPSTTSVQHIPQTLPSSRRKEYLRCFETDGNIRFSRQFGLTLWHEFTLPNWFLKYAWHLAFSTTFTNLHASARYTCCPLGKKWDLKALMFWWSNI